MNDILRTLAEAGVTLSLRADGVLQAKAPPGVLDDALRSLITRHRDALTTALAGRSRPAAAAVALPSSEGGPPPASFPQQRFWFLHQFDANAGAYAIPLAFRLTGEGPLAEQIQFLLDALAERHAILRTTFAQHDHGLIQIVHARMPVPVQCEDISGLPFAEREVHLQACMLAESRQPFNLQRGPLLRARLLMLGPQTHVLLLTVHHIIFDGWSMGVLLDEARVLLPLHAHDRGNAATALPAPALQYADFARWQRHHLDDATTRLLLDYWRAQLDGAPATMNLPQDHARPAVRQHRGGRVPLDLSPAATGRLADLARSHGATLYMVLLAAFKTLLYRCSGDTDISVGTPVSGRSRPEFEGLIGCFINTLVLRSRIDGNLPFVAFLHQVRDTALGAYAHQELPFERLVDALQPERSRAHTPLFQVMFSLQNTPRSALEIPGLRMEPLSPPAEAKFDLECAWTPDDDGLCGSFIYDADLFEADTAAAWASAYRVLLDGIAADPLTPLVDLPLPSPCIARGEQERLDQVTASEKGEPLLHQLFEAQVAARPDACAVVSAEASLTYAELDRRAQRIARHIALHGIRPDDRIALHAGRTANQIAGILGILKSGAAYVPLDPDHPHQRLAAIVADCQPLLILSQTDQDTLPFHYDGPVAALDCISEDPSQDHLPVPPTPGGLGPSSLAYVIHTSGSTGRPKGVMVEHRSAINFHAAMATSTHHGCAAGTRVALNASASFDMSLMAVLQLLSGHCIHVLPSAERMDGQALLRYLEQEQIDIFDCTPSQLEPLLAAGLLDPAQPASLAGTVGAPHRPGRVLLGGEAIPPALWSRLLTSQSIRFFNVYGPTECTVAVTLHPISHDQPAPVLGRPIRRTNLYVLDPQGRPLPPGMVGEIHIGGASVARGYLNQPALTAARFVPDPFDTTPGARMYRSGDLGRWDNDGILRFHGRNDSQIKVRGHRIEPGEIEHILRRISGVDGAAVVWQPDSGGGRILAYFTGTADPAEVRTAALDSLPAYMFPASIQRLQQLPLNANGKLDRACLPIPPADVATTSRTPPQGATEIALAALWAALVGVPHVGREDNFFTIGGHSLTAMRQQAHLRETYGVDIPVSVLFDHPVLRNFADAVDSLRLATSDIDDDYARMDEEALQQLLDAPPAH
ncbi:amino acid adenylation domain-containing protein [Stenotrophomonas sp. S48]|uniref:non-ribosomal peptide synthetase n=1 Tax=unclassified Stenotrophomonas TaxID=196198 RepID=UPI0019003077|nr:MULTISPECIES: non-ribosomal peptide synthetase [unclassified Stenotrophomonas]MBK0027694.1 amino acid adenylation domain-containing protein [Stenotrophomonas sp. S48]MBK0046982.1 amino acid adenylation domain-containing protein [Stenotrophomonas sp. S49]